MAHVSWLTIAPVKGLALVEVDELALARDGVRENRRFYLVVSDGERYGLKRDGRLALSFTQERMWFLQQMAPTMSAYNAPGAVLLEGGVVVH